MKGGVSGAWFIPISFSEKQEQMTFNCSSFSPQNTPNFKLSDSSYELDFMILLVIFCLWILSFLAVVTDDQEAKTSELVNREGLWKPIGLSFNPYIIWYYWSAE